MPERDIDMVNKLGITVADHVSALLAYWDKDMVCRFANTAYTDWFGKTREEMVDKITIKELLGPLYEKNLPYILGVLDGRMQTFEREIPTPTGGIRHSLANYFPHIVGGETMGFIVHVADVTHMKTLEENLKSSNGLINDQNKKLLNFANIVSHNLKSYANNLAGILDLFAKEESPNEKQKMVGYLQKISVGFSSTISDLSEIVKFQNDSNNRLVQIDLVTCIENSIEVLSMQILSTNTLVLNKIKGRPRVMGNSVYLDSIILNFISNCIKYKSNARDPIIELSAVLKEQELLLTIKDNGVGIDLEKYGKDLFGMYKTFHQHPEAQGIGLFLAKQQLESIGGSVSVESKVGEGTTFYITFKSP